CRPPFPTQFQISGRDSDSFHIADSSSDSISIEWTSQKPGAQQAYLIAVLADGTRDSVALAGFSTTAPLRFSVSPQRLFPLDSDYINCTSSVDTIHILADACLWPRVKSEGIAGMDSMDYSISHPLAQFDSSNSIAILFTPIDTGLRAATYELRLDNDTLITIPLAGVGLATRKLSLAASSTNQKTDTIGGMVAVPITVDGLAHAETIELVLHYPLADLDYMGSFDLLGTKVDIPGEQWPGRSKLRITGAMDGTIAAYAHFNVFSDTAYNPQITFDSLDVPTALTPCEYVPPPEVTSEIIPMQGCGIQMLSRWVHLGQRPVFGIRPNPSSGAITVTSSMDVGDVSIEVYDMLGTERAHFNLLLSNDAPATLSLPFESGLYYVRVISEAGASNVPIIIKR
ncbi:MAG TPA: T9SS type A sorting domain-containing protein, partial [Candidatus Kapabacteria bacterium]|nr:T9SS type A sorting domain-containing protein [Candidatus Kapabacteria bacterium]